MARFDEMISFAENAAPRSRSQIRIVQDGIQSIEKATNQVIAEHGALIVEMMSVLERSGMPEAAAQEALERTTDSLVASLTARGHALAAHEAMRAALKHIDVRVFGYGDGGPSPVMGQLGLERVGRLRAVAKSE